MDAATINAKIYAGRGKAALRLGYDCNLFRPTLASNPFSNGIRLTLKSAFNAGDSIYRVPNMYGDPIWFGDFDARLTLPGDYLVRPLDNQIYFIAQMQSLLPIICIDCTRNVFMRRPNLSGGVGALPYDGASEDNMTDVLGTTGVSATYWPASVTLAGRSQSAGGLPMDVKQAGWRILLPPSVPVIFRQADVLTDDLGRRYSVESAEQTDLGWRILAQEVHP